MLTNCLAACAHLTITVSEIQRYICEKIVILSYPLHSTPPLRGFPSEYRRPLWYAKTRMVSLPDGVKISKISLFVLAQLRNVTDRQTDGHRVTAKTALWYAKTGMVWLPNGEKVCITVLTEYRRVTNRRTDKRTSCYGSPRYA